MCAIEFENLVKEQNLTIIKLENQIVDELRANSDRHYSALENVNKHLIEIKNQISGPITGQSFADVLKRTPQEADNHQTKHVVIIKPKDSTIKSNTTERMAKDVISKNRSIVVKNAKRISKGGIVLECESEKDCKNAVEMILKQTEALTAEEGIKRDPKLVIYGIPDTIEEKDIICELVNNNIEIKQYLNAKKTSDLNEEIQIKFKFRQRIQRNNNNWVFSLSPDLFKTINSMKSILIGWKSCHFKEYLSIIRCFKCNEFGHKGYGEASSCTNEICCGHCGKNHASIECKTSESQAFCVNCDKYNKKTNTNRYETNHSSFSNDCQSLKRIQNLIKSKTNYG